jgi:alpha-N-acetylglucosaminidase
MVRKFLMMIFLLAAVTSLHAQLNFTGVQHLVQRRIPWLAGKIIFETIKQNESADKFDVFRLSTKNQKLFIKASSCSAASMAVNYYLREYCHQSISLQTENIYPIQKLPEVKGVVEKSTPFQFRHGNYHCTLNYTQAFWQWNEWERCIDWYALNGVNLMITLVGAEGIEQEVLRKFNYNDNEIFDLIPSPAYTNWHWLGNIEREGGPVTQNLINKQIKLQQKILKRMDELHIEPIMQGFCSLVPTNFKDKFPDAQVSSQGKWGGHTRPIYLQTTDPLFKKYADAWYSTLQKLYGKRKYFSCDILHEGGIMKDMNLKQMVPDIQNAMIRHNPDAVWVVQAWFIQADDYPLRDSTNNANPYPPLLQAALKDHIMVWDIYGENDNIWQRRKGFDGLNFMWGTLTYFGGRCGMVGKLDRYVQQIAKARELYPQQLKSIGTNPEAIENNPIWYDFIYNYAWNQNDSANFNIDAWLKKYALYRYGKTDKNINKAWSLLHQTAYSSYKQVYEGPPVSIFCEEPNYLESLDGHSDVGSWTLAWRSFKKPFYDIGKFEQAAKYFVKSEAKFRNSPTYNYDLIDITRQLIVIRGNRMYDSLMTAYKTKNIVDFERHSKQFFILMDQAELICNTNKNFRLNSWLSKAEKMGDTKYEKAMLINNAKTLITCWGRQETVPELNDYAQRQWAGMFSSYYKKRWQLFLGNCRDELQGKPKQKINFLPVAFQWINKDLPFTSLPEGNSIDLAMKFINYDVDKRSK